MARNRTLAAYHIVARFMQLCCLGIPETQPLFLAIDDTFVLRFSEKAPGCAIAYQDAHKLNLVNQKSDNDIMPLFQLGKTDGLAG